MLPFTKGRKPGGNRKSQGGDLTEPLGRDDERLRLNANGFHTHARLSSADWVLEAWLLCTGIVPSDESAQLTLPRVLRYGC